MGDYPVSGISVVGNVQKKAMPWRNMQSVAITASNVWSDSGNVDSVWIVNAEVTELFPHRFNLGASVAQLSHHYDLGHR